MAPRARARAPPHAHMSRNFIALQNKFLGHGQTVYDALGRAYEARGHLDDEDIRTIAQEHSLPLAYVRATADFYDDFERRHAAKSVLKVCNGEACRAAGCDAVIDTAKTRLGLSELGQTSGDGIHLAHVTCIGYCGSGPNALVNDAPVSLAGEGALDRVLANLEGGADHGLTEPTNAMHPPAEGQPCILMRHFGDDVRGLEAARAHGIYGALEKAVTSMTPQAVIDQVKAAGLRGRGGAGFPTGIKLQTVADSPVQDGSGRRFVVVNFDEGDAGSYIDKELVEHDAHGQLEGILLAAYATGAREAFIYARAEYPTARKVLAAAIAEAREAGLIGAPLFGTDFACDITVVEGRGAYICGEETSLLRSIEGVPGLVSIRPPYPAQVGLWGCPTAVNNVETLHNLPWIVEHGGEAYAAIGHGKSRGTKAVSLNSRVANPGMYEVPFGMTLRQIIDLAGGMAEGQAFRAVQVGGPLGGLVPEQHLDTPLDFEAMDAIGAIVGHAGMVVYSEEDDLWAVARGLMHFCAIESCGKCFPCRIGSVRGTELLDQIRESGMTPARRELLEDLCETMKYGSLCAMGSMTPAPIETILEHFPEALGLEPGEPVSGAAE